MKSLEKNGSRGVAQPRDPLTVGVPAAYVGPGVTFRGKLVHDEIVQVDGTMEGEIQTEGTVLISEGAFVDARVSAGVVLCAGTLIGDVIATGRVELRATAVLDGSLNTPLLLLEEGARANGRLIVGVDA